MNKRIIANMILLLTAAIWGLGFVAQRVGSQFVGAFTFNGIRFAIGSLSLVPLIIFFNRKNAKKNSKSKDQDSLKDQASLKETLIAGIAVGFVLYIAATLQQIGLTDSTAGKAGFITGLYMVFVPLFGIFLKHKVGLNSWIGVIVAVVGLYLLSIKRDFTIENGDRLILIGAIFWAIHILVIDKFSKRVDALKLSSLQFATCAILSMLTAFFTEEITIAGLKGSLIPILYGGLLSVGVAYTLQVVAQKNAKPSHAAIILSTESVFGAIGGALMLHEVMGSRELFGCVLIMGGILISQIDLSPKKSKSATSEVKSTV